ncbi:MAG: DUF1289 domain-containing protein [Caulobacterales bacterium]
MSSSLDQPAAMQSPCNKICTIDVGSGLCIGCFRTIEEVATWSRLSDQTRTDIMRELPSREERIAPDKRFQP